MMEARRHPIRLPLRTPLVTAAGPIPDRAGWLVEVGDEAGPRGYGEALPLRGFTDEATALAAGLAWARADRAARAAGQRLAERLAAQLGTEARDAVAVSALLANVDPAPLARAASRARAEGFAAAKLKLVAGGGAADRERVRVVREAAPDLALRVDANGSLDEAAALDLCRFLARHGVEYLEQPLPARDLAGLTRLRAHSPLPLAADESVASAASGRAVIAQRAADVLILKPTLLTPEDALELARRAIDAGLALVVTSALDGAVGRAAALHFAAALPAPLRPAGLATGALLADDLAAAPEPARGRLEVPSGPGLGIEPDPRALARLGAAAGAAA